MNAATAMTTRRAWSCILIVVGGIAMALGAINPIGGAFVILAGNGLVALGTFVGQAERRLITYRVAVFLLIAIGVGAAWGLMPAGGFGGPSGHSIWWGVLVLPILVGWSMGIWGPGSPRWLLLLGCLVSLWYLALLVITLSYPGRGGGALPGIILGTIGVLTIGGCLSRLRTRPPARR